MKKSELVQIIRGLVQEEIRKQLPQMLTEMFAGLMNNRQIVNENHSQAISPQNPQYPQYPQPTYLQNPPHNPNMPPNIPPHAEMPMVTGNPAVDAILAGTRPEPYRFGNGPNVVAEGGFDRVGLAAAVRMNEQVEKPKPAYPEGSIMGMISETISTPGGVGADSGLQGHRQEMLNAPSILDHKDELPPALSKMFNIDFKSILKKSEKGAINTGRVGLM